MGKKTVDIETLKALCKNKPTLKQVATYFDVEESIITKVIKVKTEFEGFEDFSKHYFEGAKLVLKNLAWAHCKKSPDFMKWYLCNVMSDEFDMRPVQKELLKKASDENKESIKTKQYAELESTLPIRTFENTPDEGKFSEIMSKVDSKSCDDSDRKNQHIRKEAQQFCNHNISIETSYTHNDNAKMQVIKTYTCDYCGLKVVDTVVEDI